MTDRGVSSFSFTAASNLRRATSCRSSSLFSSARSFCSDFSTRLATRRFDGHIAASIFEARVTVGYRVCSSVLRSCIVTSHAPIRGHVSFFSGVGCGCHPNRVRTGGRHVCVPDVDVGLSGVVTLTRIDGVDFARGDLPPRAAGGDAPDASSWWIFSSLMWTDTVPAPSESDFMTVSMSRAFVS